jgi:hypothetical protein
MSNIKPLDFAGVMEIMEYRFTSGNPIPVERASIKAEEWAIIKEEFEKSHDEYEELLRLTG